MARTENEAEQTHFGHMHTHDGAALQLLVIISWTFVFDFLSFNAFSNKILITSSARSATLENTS